MIFTDDYTKLKKFIPAPLAKKLKTQIKKEKKKRTLSQNQYMIVPRLNKVWGFKVVA